MNNIDVSIIITAYNYADYIDLCLESCLSQDFSQLRYEVIVVDDGSTDDTMIKVKEWLMNYSEDILRYIKIDNSGIEKSSNIGIEASKGKYLVRVDADDALKHNYLKEISGYIIDEVAFIYPDYAVINSAGDIVQNISLPSFDKEEILCRGDFLATGTLYNTKLIKQYGGYSTEVRNCGLEHYELVLKMLSNGCSGLHVPKTLFFYRRHGANISTKRVNSIIEYGRNLFEKNHWGEYSTNQYHPYSLKLDKVGKK